MTTLKGGEVILKTDGRGRVKTPAERRERLLDEFERSGLSGARFAALAGVKYPTFAAWAQRRRQLRSAGTPTNIPAAPVDKMRWLEAVLEQAQPSGASQCDSLMLHLPGGVRMEITGPKQVMLAAALVRALEHPATAC